MQIETEEIEDKILLHLDGRLDANSSPTLEKRLTALIEENHLKLILDFSKVDYLSSAGLRLLLSITKKVKAKGGFLVIYSLDDDVMEIITMAGFDTILNICQLESDALQFNG